MDFIGVVDIPVGRHGRIIPDVELFEFDAPAVDQAMARAPDAEIDLGRVVAERRGLFARVEHFQRDPDCRGKPGTGAQLV